MRSSLKIQNMHEIKPKKIKILLSSPIKPFGSRFGDSFSCQTSGSHQLTWAQDIFRVEDQMWHWGLDLIAANIDIPTTVLHYPTLCQFVEEIKNDYDYIGLSYNLATFHKLKKMVDAIRKYAPESKIILGGYGTVLPDEELEGLGDYICREEGLKFIRNLFKENEKPFVSPNFIIKRYIFSLMVGKIGVIFSAVGCPNGCDFCCTSHYYKRKKVYFYKTGGELFKAIIDFRNANKSISSIIIFDDDFLVDKARAREFLDLVRASKEHLDIMIFASVKSLSQFTASEIAEMGITKIWIGFEGVKAGYEKQNGRPFNELMNELRYYGISVTASMMVGFDYQTKDIIIEELKELVSCFPTATQIILVTPCVGTPLWGSLNSQDRLIKQMKEDYKFHDGFNLLFKHPNISSKEMEDLQRELYNKEYQLLGPSLFRVLYTQYQGYKNLKESENIIFKKRAESFLNNLKKANILYKIGIKFSPNSAIKKELIKQNTEIASDIGDLRLIMKLLRYLLVPFIWWTRMRFKYNLFMQPKFIKKVYNSR